MMKLTISMIVMSLVAVTSTAQMFKPQSFYDKKYGKPTDVQQSGFDTEVVYKVQGRLFVAIQFDEQGKAFTKGYYKKALFGNRNVHSTPEEREIILEENGGGKGWTPFVMYTSEMIAKTPDPKLQEKMRRHQAEIFAWERKDKLLYAEYNLSHKVLTIDVHHDWDGVTPLVP